MNPDETDTLPQGGTDNVTPENDTAPEWDYFDPDENQDTEVQQEAATDEGESEAEAPEEQSEEEPAPPELLELPDGTKIAKDEAIKGYLRQADYTRKSQDLAQKRQAAEAHIADMQGVLEAFVDHLTSLVPAAPDPALAMRDAQAYVRQDAAHRAAMAKVQELIDLGRKPKEIKEGISTEARAERVAEENRKLVERVPETATEDGRRKFFDRAARAAEELGFTMDELKAVNDHRIFLALQLAQEGLAARKARDVAKAKVAKVPPVAPRKPGGQADNAGANAMRRLARSGSIRDAMMVDFD